MSKKIFALIAAVVIMFSAFAGCAKTNEEVSSDAQSAEDVTSPVLPEEGGPAPDFTATLTNGDTFTLSEHKDEVVLVNFWATWCPPCVREMPAFQQLSDENIEGFSMIAVNCSEWQNTVNEFLEENGYTFNVAYDVDGTIRKLYPTDGIPYTLIVNKGIIEKIYLGAPSDAYTEYKSAIEGCFGE